jgi:hypothetical protein
MKFLTALGLAAGGASKTIQEGLDREQKEKDREARSAEAAAGRQHTTDLLYKRRRFDQMDKLVEVQEALFALGLNEQQVAANMSGGMANVERLQNLKTISADNNIDFPSALNVTFGENFNAEDIQGGAVNFVQSNLLDARLEGKVYKNPYRTEISDQLKALESIGDPVGFKKQIENQYNSIYRLEQLIDKGTNVEQNQKLVNQKRDLITELTKKYIEMEQTTGGGLLTSGYMSLALRKVKDSKKGAFGELIVTDNLGRVQKKFTGNYGRAFEAYLTSIDGIRNEIQAYNPSNPRAISGGSAAFMNELTVNANTQLVNEYNLEYFQRIKLGAERDRDPLKTADQKPMEISLLNPLSDVDKRRLKAGDVVKHIVNNQPKYEIFRGFATPNQSNPTGIQFFMQQNQFDLYNPQQ